MNLLWRCCVSLLCLVWLAPAKAQGLSEDQVKAAYVLNFIKFAEWPNGAEGNSGKMTLCVIGNEPLGETLGAMEGRKAGNRELHIVPHLAAGDDLSGCQVVYIGESVRQRFLSIIKALDEASVLTISSIEGFAEKGGDIGLVYQENKMLFEVNLAAIRKGRLHLPSQMLNLAANIFGR